MITDIRVQNFRSYPDESYEFNPGVNIIVGPNASGKTNLLEAILLLSLGKSYRGKDSQVIKHKKPWARIDAHQQNNTQRTLKIEKIEKKTIKTYELDGVKHKKLILERKIPIVLFEPNNNLLFHNGPEDRRSYLDDILDQTTAQYPGLKKKYQRVLSQRNTLLKRGIGDKNELFVWNIRLSELGEEMVKNRLKLVKKIAKDLSKNYSQIAKSKHKLTLEYIATCNIKQYGSDMLKKLDLTLDDDLRKGFTTIGPHREDFDIKIDGHSIKESASRGETRTIILALKVSEKDLIEKERGQKPILLLDDVFSELDGSRRKALTQHLKDYQTFITTTDADVVIKNFTTTCNIIPIARP